jgi:hypothetical protein
MAILHALRDTDLGDPKLKGSSTRSLTGLDVTAGGKDIWEKDDEGHFVYIEHTGDFDLVCRVESLTSADLYTKAGIMAREDSGPGSRYAYFLVFPDNAPRNKNNGGYEFSFRDTPGGDCHAIYPPDAPGDPAKFPIAFPNVWLRLARRADNFIASASNDGNHWKQYSQFSLALKSTLLLGFAVTSHNTEETVTAKFRDVRMMDK